jgi:hypothetical protein
MCHYGNGYSLLRPPLTLNLEPATTGFIPDSNGGFGWFAQLDICSFFPSIDRGLLLEFVHARLHTEELMWLAEVVVSHDPAADPVLTCSREKWRKIPPLLG